MKLKKHISLLLAFIVFSANIGYSFTVHYCNDMIASVALTSNFDEPCAKNEASCCAVEASHDDCCSNKIIKLEKNSDDFLTKSLKFETTNAVLNAFPTFEFATKNVLISSNENPAFYCESNAPPLYKLYCQLVLYA